MSRIMIVLFIGVLLQPKRAFLQPPSSVVKDQEEIVGLWQEHSALVGSGLNDNWRFFKDGHFVYNLNGNELNPLHAIIGSFYIKDSLLYLKVKQFRQWTGYKIVAPDPAFEFGAFKLEGGEITTVEQKDKEYSDHPFKIEGLSGHKTIKIDRENFFKVSNDPNKEP